MIHDEHDHTSINQQKPSSSNACLSHCMPHMWVRRHECKAAAQVRIVDDPVIIGKGARQACHTWTPANQRSCSTTARKVDVLCAGCDLISARSTSSSVLSGTDAPTRKPSSVTLICSRRPPTL